MSYWDYYKPSRPREAKGGIKSQSKRGTGTSWWAKRWISVLESFDLGARLTRGRSYARSGQVVSIDVQPGIVRAKVQGSSAKPYGVDIKIKTLSEAEWQRVAEALSEQALFAAKLLNGEMPDEIEDVFQQAGLSLLPATVRDLETDCTCPDWSNPCKHIAAVYYLLGEEFNRDPFLIFRMRGITREAFTDLLSDFAETAAETEQESAVSPEPLATETDAFWNGQPLPEDFFGEVSAPPVMAALPKRLGNFPFWRGDQPLLDTLVPLYLRASPVGMDIFLGERRHREQNTEKSLKPKPFRSPTTLKAGK